MDKKYGEGIENPETMKVSMKGTVEKLNLPSWSSIRGADEERYIFYPETCTGGIEAFNNLHPGTRVIFNGYTSEHLKNTADSKTPLGFSFKLAYENGFHLMAVNVVVDRSGETNALIPETEAAVTKVLDIHGMKKTI